MSRPAEHIVDPMRVLIVDDDLTILGLLKEIVSMVPGCEVLTASKPEDAMKFIVGGSIDIVFTDIHMPGVTGLEMIEDMISLEQSPEVIVMTAYPSGEIAQKAMEFGASSLLAKPFEDIKLVEIELDKAVKKILRQKAAAEEVARRKLELSATSSGEIDTDPVTHVSLEAPETTAEVSEGQEEPLPSEEKPKSPSAPAVLESDKPVYPVALLEPLVEIEIPRCKRYNRQFTLGLIDLPENLQLRTMKERMEFRKTQVDKLKSCFRNSDVIIDAEKDGFAVLGFECNTPGSNVLEFKLAQNGFDFCGFAVFPVDADNFEDLKKVAEERLLDKRRHHLVLYEPDEFFGRIVQNMLTDPKYQVSYFREKQALEKFVQEKSEKIKLMMISLSTDQEQWELLAKFKKEGLTQWPVLLFTDVALNPALKKQFLQLGIRAIVRKGSAQEELQYVVQSFIMSGSATILRKNARALVTLPAMYQIEGKQISSNTFTLSRDGVFIREMNPPPTGATIQLEVLIPSRKAPLKAKGEVLYSVPYFVGVNRIHVPGMAVKFVDLSDEDKSDIDQYVSQALTGYLIEES